MKKLPIVNDGIEYKNDKKKLDGYSLKDGKKSTKTNELKVNNGNRYNHVYVEDDSKKKVDLTGYNTNSFNGDRIEPIVCVFDHLGLKRLLDLTACPANHVVTHAISC